MAPPEQTDHRMSNEIGKQVFTTNGVYVGSVQDITLDLNGEKATQLAVTDLNLELFDDKPRGCPGVLIPYRWVRATNDVVLVADVIEHLSLRKDSSSKSVRSIRSEQRAEEQSPAGERKNTQTPTQKEA